MEASEIEGEPVLEKKKKPSTAAECWTIEQGSRFSLHVLDGLKDCEVCGLVWFGLPPSKTKGPFQRLTRRHIKDK